MKIAYLIAPTIRWNIFTKRVNNGIIVKTEFIEIGMKEGVAFVFITGFDCSGKNLL
ncbi:MAG: hypothetical protein JJE17_10185 [Peptostreptococcaceae bacterium]|nr:hypothetical protein [Peptostreptococcaceae bacterium]